MDVNLPFILIATLIATMSPGPGTLIIANTAVEQGRKLGVATALGVTTGSIMWSTGAALGLGAIMLANGWVFEVIRYIGALYLIYIAFKSAKSAIFPSAKTVRKKTATNVKSAYAMGLAVHLTNPKVILFFGSLYSIGVSNNATPYDLLLVIAALGIQSFVVFMLYAFIFSISSVVNFYNRAKRWFEALFALAFGAAGIAMLTSRLN